MVKTRQLYQISERVCYQHLFKSYDGEWWFTLIDEHKNVMFSNLVLIPNEATKKTYTLPRTGTYTIGNRCIQAKG